MPKKTTVRRVIETRTTVIRIVSIEVTWSDTEESDDARKKPESSPEMIDCIGAKTEEKEEG